MAGSRSLSKGMIAFGVFLCIGAAMAALAGVTLIWPGTILGRAWAVHEDAYRQLASHGRAAGILFFGVSAALALAGAGWFKRKRWGWRLATAIIAIQALGDGANGLRGEALSGSIGFVIAGAVLLYLLRQSVRTVFISERNARARSRTSPPADSAE